MLLAWLNQRLLQPIYAFHALIITTYPARLVFSAMIRAMHVYQGDLLAVLHAAQAITVVLSMASLVLLLHVQLTHIAVDVLDQQQVTAFPAQVTTI